MLCTHLKMCPSPQSQSASTANANEEYGGDLKSRSPNTMVCRVPKQSGEIHICVDLKLLNENVLKEVHPLPEVETTLSQLSGATVFSKIDTNSRFWQIPLDPESRMLTYTCDTIVS